MNASLIRRRMVEGTQAIFLRQRGNEAPGAEVPAILEGTHTGFQYSGRIKGVGRKSKSRRRKCI